MAVQITAVAKVTSIEDVVTSIVENYSPRSFYRNYYLPIQQGFFIRSGRSSRRCLFHIEADVATRTARSGQGRMYGAALGRAGVHQEREGSQEILISSALISVPNIDKEYKTKG